MSLGFFNRSLILTRHSHGKNAGKINRHFSSPFKIEKYRFTPQRHSAYNVGLSQRAALHRSLAGNTQAVHGKYPQ